MLFSDLATMSGKLSNSKVIESQQASFKASAAVQTYVAAILKQADMKLDEMPLLTDHQKKARSHATQWNSQIRPGMILTNSDIIDFSNAFNTYYNDLIDLADKVATDERARKDFITGLTALRKHIGDKHSKVEKVEATLKEFQAYLTEDYTTFKTDAKNASDIYVGDDGEIAKLNKQISSLQSDMNTYIGLMAGGAIGILAGIVMICVGALAEIPTAGLSTGLIMGGIGLGVGGITTTIAGGAKYGLAVEQMGEVREQLADDKIGLLAIGVVKGTLDGLVAQLGDAVTAAGTLVQSWKDLDGSFEKVISDIVTDPGTYGPTITVMLKSAREDWSEALSQAKKMQPSGLMPVQEYKRIQDAINIKHG